mgnify:CR=1 FL=1
MVISNTIDAHQASEIMEKSIGYIFRQIRLHAENGDDFFCLHEEDLDENKKNKLIELEYDVSAELSPTGDKYWRVSW